jgi:hypothetical protein
MKIHLEVFHELSFQFLQLLPRSNTLVQLGADSGVLIVKLSLEVLQALQGQGLALQKFLHSTADSQMHYHSEIHILA